MSSTGFASENEVVVKGLVDASTTMVDVHHSNSVVDSEQLINFFGKENDIMNSVSFSKVQEGATPDADSTIVQESPEGISAQVNSSADNFKSKNPSRKPRDTAVNTVDSSATTPPSMAYMSFPPLSPVEQCDSSIPTPSIPQEGCLSIQSCDVSMVHVIQELL